MDYAVFYHSGYAVSTGKEIKGMAIIDYHGIRSQSYARLTLPAKALIPVLATLADDETGKLTHSDSKLDTLKYYSGLSRNSIRAGLRNLEKSKQISLTRSQGHAAQITYLPIINFAQNQAIAGCARGGQLANHEVHSQLSEKNTVDQHYDTLKQEWQGPCSLNTVLNTKTTTGQTLPKILIKEMIQRHGSDVVVSIVSEMEKIMKAKPGEIKNPGGYFRSCCQNGWVPTSKNIQEKEQIQAARIRARAIQDEADRQEAKRRQRIKSEQNDPEVQKRIGQMQLSFLNLSNTIPRQSDPRAISDNAKPQNELNG